MMKTKKISLFLMGIVACLSLCLSVVTFIPKFSNSHVAKAATYTTKDVAMLGSVAGWYGNGNFEIRLTLGECDWAGESGQKTFDTTLGLGDLPTLLKNLGFFDHIQVGGKTLAEWGCTSCYGNYYWLNEGEPKYTLMIPLAMGTDNMTTATSAGVGANSRLTILEGALIPSYAYLQGDTTATVYRAGCDFVTESSDVAYGVLSYGKTEVESIDYVTGWDSTYNNAYLGVSLKGDDFLGDKTVVERHPDYYSSVYTTNLFPNKITVDGEAGKTEAYGLFNHGKSDYYSFVIRTSEDDAESITIPAGTLFPSRAMRTLFDAYGNPVYIMYQTQTDVTFYKQADGTWEKELVEKETAVTSVKVAGEDSDNFTVISLSNHDYPDYWDNWNSGEVAVKDFFSKHDFYSHVEINDAKITDSASHTAHVNIWSNKGSVGIRTTAGLSATKITILKGCKFPTANALRYGANEAYVTTADITFVKNGDVWEKYIPEGDFDTKVTQVQFGRGNTNVLNINLSVNDYPAPDGNDASTYNIGVDKDKILALNFFDNVIVDGYTLRSLYARYGEQSSNEMWINKFVGHNFAITVPSENGDAITPDKIVIRAGTQFPSLAYLNSGAKAYYVTQEEVTYVRVSDNVETSWDRQAKITFVADNQTIATRTYTKTNGIDGEIPEVPQKTGYKGVWSSYSLTGEDITVNATYTAHGFIEDETNLTKFEYKDGFLVIFLTNHDYTGAGYTLDTKDRVVNLHFFNYVEIDGEMEATQPTASTGAFINVWGGYEGAFATYVPSGATPTQKIVFKKGCQIPSNAYRLDASNLTCYVLTEDVTFLYDSNTSTWVRQASESGDVSLKPTYENDYVLSDLYNTGHAVSAELEKGYLLVDTSTDGNVYGYNTSNSFSLTFDFSLNIGDNDVSAQGDYTTFTIAMATRGYNSSHTFGWRIYLYRPNSTAKCVEIYSSKSDYFVTNDDGSNNGGNITNFAWDTVQFEKDKTYRVTFGYKLLDATNGTVEIYINVDGYEVKESYELGSQYMNYAPYVDSIAFASSSAIANGVRISDPDLAEDEQNYTVTLSNGTTQILSESTNVYTLPTLLAYEYAENAGDVFVGWTTDKETLPNLYPAGYELTLSADTTLYPVWINFALKDGAAVRKTGESGIRFTVNVNGSAYQTWINAGLIASAGTLVVPTSYLDSGREFVHESFPTGYFVDVPTTSWTTQTGDVWTYVAALVNISPSQYTRAMSARGYLKVNYTTGEGYVYTAYSKDLHSRSIYEVATKAYEKGDTGTMVTVYLDNVADIVIDESFEVSKNGVGDYSFETTINDKSYTLTVNNAVKAVMINGVRLVMGYDAEIVVGNAVYSVSGYKLSSNGLTITFTLETGDETAYYASIVEYYKNSTDYTELHKQKIDAIIENWGENYSDSQANANYLAELESVKTATELKNNVGSTQLATPVVTYGLGYSVTWNAIENADYYYVTDDNDYRNGVYTTETSYKPEVVGKHNVTVTAFSYNEEYQTSKQSAEFATIEVKPVFTYKAMTDGLYKFTSSQLSTLGLSSDGCYEDSGEYFMYYNKTTGWSPNQANATDWTSPVEFPAHAQRLKAMGNNVLLIAEDTAASFKTDSVWSTSRTKYVMDTAWSMGLKVIVCDEAFYTLSRTVSSQSAAASTIASRGFFADYVSHPAFFGFSLADEPSKDEVDSVGYMITALKDACANLGYSKANGNEPFFLACLFQKNTGFSTIWNYESYLNNWFNYTGLDYVYVDLYTDHAMGETLADRYQTTYETLYGSEGTDGVVTGTAGRKFHQVITAHTQDKNTTGSLSEQDLYMSMLYAAAHNVAGYSWFCYFPIVGELAGSMVGFDGNGYGNGIGNGATTGYSYYNAAKTAGYQFELIQGVLNGYSFTGRIDDSSSCLTTTTLSNGSNTITFYVNADSRNMEEKIEVTASGSVCYLVGYGVGTADAPYQVVSGSITLEPGQAVICVG
ncbi:MAG: hypothetical protein IJW64_00760 [Clostridia bacterium]|nr:hypothetical protein [Clostridia bacterium]